MLASLQSLKRVPYFDNYLKRVVHEDLRTELLDSKQVMIEFISSLDDADLDMRYAPNKWTIREVIIHVIECELIFAYRALTIAREEGAVNLPGFEENDYIRAIAQDPFGIKELRDAFESVRNLTLFVMQTMDKSQLKKVGIASGHEAEVQALFYVTSGHGRHHQHVIESKYLLR